MPLPFTTDQLDALRKIGDPEFEDARTRQRYDQEGRQPERQEEGQRHEQLARAVRDLVSAQGPTEQRLKSWEAGPPAEESERALRNDWMLLVKQGFLEIDDDLAEQIEVAQGLFATYGREIAAALLLAGLPQTFACQWGAPVLTATGQLTTNLQTRIRGTAQFLLRVMLADPESRESFAKKMPSEQWASNGAAFKATIALRLFHASTREGIERLPDSTRLVGPENSSPNRPLNQEDLLGALLTFTVTVFEVLEMLDIAWTADEQQAYLTTWDVVGRHLGIGGPAVMRAAGFDLEHGVFAGRDTLVPQTVPAARAALDQLRDRQWLDLDAKPQQQQWRDLTPGRLLTRALLDSLVDAVPPVMKLWPESVMRQLNPRRVGQRLALGGGGLLELAADHLPRRRIELGRFTREYAPNALTGRALRAMANEVSRRALLRFLQDGQRFSFPGLEEWSDGLASR